MPTKKQIAQEFLRLCSKGESREAFKLYVDASFKHHNAYYPGDAQSLMLGMEESAQNMPLKEFTMLRALEDGDLVAVHSRVKMHPQAEQAFVVMHILHFNSDNKIVEMWDFGQEVPEECPNENGMF